MASMYCTFLSCVTVILVTLAAVVVSQTEPTTFEVSPEDTSAAVGFPVTIYCSVTNIGRQQVFWNIVQNSTSDFTLGPNYNTHASFDRFQFGGGLDRGEFNLRISEVQKEDAGRYICLLNDPFNEMSVAQEAGARLTVLDAPVAPLTANPQCESSPVGVDGQNGVFKQGDVLTLTCTSRGGVPLPELAWERVKENNAIDKLPGKTTVRGDMVTTSADVRLSSEDHQSRYKCSETHPSASTPRLCETETSMNVRFEPEVDITPSAVYVQLFETSVVTLRCVASGYPELSSGPTIVLPVNKTGTFSEDRSSVEVSLTTDDIGKDFYCRAVNEVGVGEAGVEIKQLSLLPTWLTLVIIAGIGFVILIVITIVSCALCVDRSKHHDESRSRSKDGLRYSVNKSLRGTSLRREGEDDFIDGFDGDMLPIEDFQGGRETMQMQENTNKEVANDFETGEAGTRYQNVNEAFQTDDSIQSNSISQSNPSYEHAIDGDFE
ncbi:hemicentin-1-like [Asterias rubens]|uniref:hemicentin-1-like n=1 Tax=Asterias rubens TaxID=7604 RepID=UPI0014550774|nr:hemicentin-1-like [Asterias rubens]